MRARPTVGELACLVHALEAERSARPAVEQALRRRGGADDLVCLRDWLGAVDEDSARRIADTDAALRAVSGGALAAGALLGLVTALGVFFYDGSGRVNVLAVLGVMVVLPGVLLLSSWLGASPRGSGAVARALGALGAWSPGRLVARWSRRAGRRGSSALATLLDPRHHVLGLAPVRRWAVVRWSHLLGTGFFLGALATLLALVVFTDLAFGWSTTLRATPEGLRDLVAVVAAPWAWAVPAASPDLETIAATRWFRAGQGGGPTAPPALLGQWWPFLAAALAVYGLLPRIASAALASMLLRRATGRAFVGLPAARALLARIGAAEVDTRAPTPEPAPPPPEAPRRLEAPVPVVGGCEAVVSWSAVPVPDLVLADLLDADRVLHAGGARTVAEDEAVLDALADGAGRVVVVTKAWEPPLLELRDFVDALVARRSGAVAVMPVAVDDGVLRPPRAADLAVWERGFADCAVPLVAPPREDRP